MSLYDRVCISLVVAALALGAARPAAGSTIVFQSVPNLTASGQIDQYGWCSACGGFYRIFDQFTLGSAQTITGLSVSVYDHPPYWPASVSFSVWTVVSGLPGVQLFSQTIDSSFFTTTPFDSLGAVVHTDSVTGLSLAGGTYYASFYNPSGLAINSYFGGGGNLYQQGLAFIPGKSAGFILYSDTAAVPEPSTLLLLGTGLVAVAVRRRPKTRK